MGIMWPLFWHHPVDPASGFGSPWHNMEHTQVKTVLNVFLTLGSILPFLLVQYEQTVAHPNLEL